MDKSVKETSGRPRGGGGRLAYSIAEFAALAGISTDLVYDEIKRGALRARKARTRTIVTEQDAQDYLQGLPSLCTQPVGNSECV